MKQRNLQTTYKNATARQTASVLSKLILALVVISFVLILSGLFAGDWKMVAVAGAGIVLQVLPYLLIRSGKIFAGSITLVVLVLALVTVFATIGQGIRDIALVVMPVIYIFAGLTFNRVILWITIALTIVSISWLALGEYYGWFIPYNLTGKPGLSELLMAVVVLLFVAMAVSLLITNMRRYLDQLKADEEKFKELFDKAPVAMARTKIDGSAIMEANQALCKLSGYSRQELLRKAVSDLWAHSEKRDAMMALLQKNNYLESYEFDLVDKTGATRNCLGNFKLDPEEGYLEVSITDITERKKVEKASRENEQLLTTFVKHSPIYTFIKKVTPDESRVMVASANYQNMIGIAASEMVGKTMGEMFPPELAAKMTADDWSVVSSGKVVKIDEDLNNRNYTSIKFPITLGENQLLAGYTIDITERKVKEKELAESHALTQSIIESTGDLIWSVDPVSFGLITFNHALSEHYLKGYSIVLQAGMRPEELFAAQEYIDKWKAFYRRALAEGSYSTEYTGYSGRIIMDMTFNLLRNRDEVFGISVFGKNITARKQAEVENQKLREKAEMSSRLAAVGEMAAGIAHEINNPLTGVIGFAQLLDDRQDLPEDVRDQLRIIADGGNRVKDIVRRMLTFARQHKPVRTSASINELIDATLDLRTYVLKTANIEVVKRLDPNLPKVTVDPGQMQQVFLNIIVNAEYSMKKAHGKGNLVITTEKKDDHIRISFTDDGTGMSQETKAKLFNPFFTTKQVNEGTGLGLGLSRSIILEHSGTIEVESEMGEGATITITLPIIQPAETEPAAVIPAAQAAKVKVARILVVDDEPAIRSLVSTILTRNGHSVDATDDAAVALSRLDSAVYDLVLMDIRMPGMSGMELYAKVLEKHPELAGKLLFITGDTSDSQIKDFLEQNKMVYISKPFDRESLLKKVNGLL